MNGGKNMLVNLCKDGKPLASQDYEQMADYIRCKEYINGLIDAQLILKNSVTIEEAVEKLRNIIDCCIEMRYITLKKMFGL